VGDRPPHGSLHVGLTLDDVLPQRRVRVLEVGHEDARAGVERIDDHLPVDGTGDLDAAILNVGRNRSAGPGSVADCTRLRQKIRQLAGIEVRLSGCAPRKQLGATNAEGTLQAGGEAERVGRKYLGIFRRDAAGNFDSGGKGRLFKGRGNGGGLAHGHTKRIVRKDGPLPYAALRNHSRRAPRLALFCGCGKLAYIHPSPGRPRSRSSVMFQDSVIRGRRPRYGLTLCR